MTGFVDIFQIHLSFQICILILIFINMITIIAIIIISIIIIIIILIIVISWSDCCHVPTPVLSSLHGGSRVALHFACWGEFQVIFIIIIIVVICDHNYHNRGPRDVLHIVITIVITIIIILIRCATW